jgi:hypothetical protein
MRWRFRSKLKSSELTTKMASTKVGSHPLATRSPQITWARKVFSARKPAGGWEAPAGRLSQLCGNTTLCVLSAKRRLWGKPPSIM